MNLLILSVGTRNKVISYFRKELQGQGKVIATDMSELAPALYEADIHYIVPRMTEAGYLDIIYDICSKENVSGVLSLLDPELSLLAQHEADFSALGVTVIGSSYELCERALNKMEMFRWLTEHGYPCARSYTNPAAFFTDEAAGEITYPVIVKPVCGSASIGITKAYDRQTVELLFAHSENLMIQQFLDGQEIGADCYIDIISGEVVSIFTKKKILMRAGETDKAVSFQEEALFALIERFVQESCWRGQIDIDLFEVEGTYYLSEVNPRFGGGYPHAYECGVSAPQFILKNLNGQKNEVQIGAYENNVFMMKYNEIKLLRN